MESVGVAAWYSGDFTSELKQAAMIFDKIAFKHFHSKGEYDLFSTTEAGKRTLEKIELLQEKDILRIGPELILDEDKAFWLKDHQQLAQYFQKLDKPDLKMILVKLALDSNDSSIFSWAIRKEKALRKELRNINKNESLSTAVPKHLENLKDLDGILRKDLYCRLAAMQLRNTKKLDAVPIIENAFLPNDLNYAESSNIVRFIYDKIPFATGATPWEAIFDFRDDEEGRKKLLRFRKWLANKFKDGNTTVNELNDEINELLFDYEAYMSIQHKKFQTSKMETLIVSTVELIEGIPKLQISKALKTLFKISKLKIELLEDEIKAPGNEIAFISNLKTTFSKRKHNRRKRFPFF
jgi:hypothetical protein